MLGWLDSAKPYVLQVKLLSFRDSYNWEHLHKQSLTLSQMEDSAMVWAWRAGVLVKRAFSKKQNKPQDSAQNHLAQELPLATPLIAFVPLKWYSCVLLIP